MTTETPARWSPFVRQVVDHPDLNAIADRIEAAGGSITEIAGEGVRTFMRLRGRFGAGDNVLDEVWYGPEATTADAAQGAGNPSRLINSIFLDWTKHEADVELGHPPLDVIVVTTPIRQTDDGFVVATGRHERRFLFGHHFARPELVDAWHAAMGPKVWRHSEESGWTYGREAGGVAR